MKTIIYSLIAIFIFGIIAMGFTKNATTTIIIQALDKNNSSIALSESAKIISARLKSFSSEQYDVAEMPEKNQIKVSLTNHWDINIVEHLLIQKGELSFYESYSRNSLSELLHNDNHLFSLLKADNADSQDAKIGCASLKEIDTVDDYLNNFGLNQQCKFAWSQSKNSEACLYALKLSKEKGPLLGCSEIESIKSVKDKISKYYDIEIRFKKSAVDTWSDATKRNSNRAIVIVLDNKVIYAPVLKSEMNDGLCQISGNLTETDAKFFAAVGSNGVLATEFKVVK
jgi:preprotein translocase subunit SecD